MKLAISAIAASDTVKIDAGPLNSVWTKRCFYTM